MIHNMSFAFGAGIDLKIDEHWGIDSHSSNGAWRRRILNNDTRAVGGFLDFRIAKYVQSRTFDKMNQKKQWTTFSPQISLTRTS